MSFGLGWQMVSSEKEITTGLLGGTRISASQLADWKGAELLARMRIATDLEIRGRQLRLSNPFFQLGALGEQLRLEEKLFRYAIEHEISVVGADWRVPTLIALAKCHPDLKDRPKRGRKKWSPWGLLGGGGRPSQALTRAAIERETVLHIEATEGVSQRIACRRLVERNEPGRPENIYEAKAKLLEKKIGRLNRMDGLSRRPGRRKQSTMPP